MQQARAKNLTEIDPPLPHSDEAEMSVLGAVILDPAKFSLVSSTLQASDFFDPRNRKIFSAMQTLSRKRAPVESMSIIEELSERGELDDAGGIIHVSQLTDGLPRVNNTEYHCQTVKKYAARRQVIYAATAIREQAFATADLSEIVSRARQMFTEVDTSGKAAALKTCTPAELAALVVTPVEYTVFPIALRGMIAVIDGQPKISGKTTLVFHAVAASRKSQVFLGQPSKKTNVLIVSEENRRTLQIAVQRAGLASAEGVHLLSLESWCDIPWPTLAERIERTCEELKIGWLVLDTFFEIARLGQEQEKDAGIVSEAARPIRAMTGRLDMAVTLTRHERKSGGDVGQSGRGSSALTGAVDVIVQLTRLPASHKAAMRQVELAGRVEVGSFKIELLDGKYVRHDADVRTATLEDVEAVDQAIQNDSAISEREIARLAGVDRNRVKTLAAKAGWTRRGSKKGPSVWERTLPI